MLIKEALQVFWNQNDRRLHAFWRILVIQAIFWGAFVGLEAITIHVTDPWLVSHGPLGVFVRYRYLHVLRAVLTLMCLMLAARVVDRRPFADYGLHWGKVWWRQFAQGFALSLRARRYPFPP